MEIMSISWIIPEFLVSFHFRSVLAKQTPEKEAYRPISLETFRGVSFLPRAASITRHEYGLVFFFFFFLCINRLNIVT